MKKKEKKFKAVYSMHVDFKDEENHEANIKRKFSLKPGKIYCFDNEQSVSYNDIVQTINTTINKEIKGELSKYIDLAVLDVQVQSVYEGSIEVLFTVILNFLDLVGELKDLYDAIILIREISERYIGRRLKEEYGDYFRVRVNTILPGEYSYRFIRNNTKEKIETVSSPKRDAFFYYLLIVNIILILVVGMLVFGAVQKVYF